MISHKTVAGANVQCSGGYSLCSDAQIQTLQNAFGDNGDCFNGKYVTQIQKRNELIGVKNVLGEAHSQGGPCTIVHLTSRIHNARVPSVPHFPRNFVVTFCSHFQKNVLMRFHTRRMVLS